MNWLAQGKSLRIVGIMLITLGVLVSGLVLFGLGPILRHARWYLAFQWGPDGRLRHQDNAYESLYQWANQATQHGTQAEQLLGLVVAGFLILLGIVFFLWARDRSKVRQMTGDLSTEALK